MTLSLLPDPGEPRTPAVTPAPQPEPTWLDQLAGVAGQHPLAVAVAASSLFAAAFVGAMLIGRRRKTADPLRIDGNVGRKVMVFIAAGIGSGFTVFSMWRVFEHQLHISNEWLRLVLCGVFEIAMLSSALNSRAFRIKNAADQLAEDKRRADVLKDDPKVTFADDRKPVDVDGIVAWIIGLLSGLFCALDATNTAERGIRFVLPLLVVWMWERAIASDLRTFTRSSKKRKITLRVSLERILVALRLAEPSGRGVDEVDRTRYRAAFTVAAFRLHVLLAGNAWPVRVTYARWRLRRAGIAIMKRFGVNELTAAREDVATLYGIEKETSPDAVEDLTPWRPSRVIDGTTTDAVTGQPPRITVAATVTPVRRQPVTPGPSSRPVTDGRDAAAVPSPRREMTPSPATRQPVTDGQTGGVTRVSPLSRDAIDAEYREWTPDRVKAYATERAQQVLAEGGSKTDGMREYFLLCLALGVDPEGSAMARAVDAAGSLGRTAAKKWHGELAVADAEQELRDVFARITAERAAGGDGRD